VVHSVREIPWRHVAIPECFRSRLPAIRHCTNVRLSEWDWQFTQYTVSLAAADSTVFMLALDTVDKFMSSWRVYTSLLPASILTCILRVTGCIFINTQMSISAQGISLAVVDHPRIYILGLRIISGCKFLVSAHLHLLTLSLTSRILPIGMSSYAATGTPRGTAVGIAAAGAGAATGRGGADAANTSTSLAVIRASGPVPFTS